MKKYQKTEEGGLLLITSAENLGQTTDEISGKYSCLICKKTFNLKSDIKIHLSVNHKISPCKKSYTTTKGLNRHWENIHENHRPQECFICQKTFTYRTSLKMHLKEMPI